MFLYGGWRVIHGATTIGTFVAFMACQMRFMPPLQAFMGMYTNLATVRVSLRRVAQILDEPIDVSDGSELWRSRLPAGGQATPMAYLGADGREYLLVVAGGHGSTKTKAGDSVIAYALPRR